MQCRHDEALLRAGRESLARAEAEVGEAEAAHRCAGDLEWGGPAADSFRARTAFIAAELAAVTAGIAALACVLASVQDELQECLAAQSSVATTPDGLPAAGPLRPITSHQGPLLPVGCSGPILAGVRQPQMLPYQSGAAVPATLAGQEPCR